MDFIYLRHPSPEVRQAVSLTAVPKNFKIMDPVPYKQMLDLIEGCSFIVTDSGGIQEEAPSLGKPVLVMRDTTERPEGIAAGTLRLVGTDEEDAELVVLVALHCVDVQ